MAGGHAQTGRLDQFRQRDAVFIAVGNRIENRDRPIEKLCSWCFHSLIFHYMEFLSISFCILINHVDVTPNFLPPFNCAHFLSSKAGQTERPRATGWTGSRACQQPLR